MDVARPYSAVVPSVDGDVLVALARTTASLTGRQVSALAHRGSQKAVSISLDRLVDQGLVLRESAGRAHLHALNRDHVAAPIVELLASMRTTLFERLGRHIEEWLIAPINASVFGSAARGDGDIDSDIDIFLVRPEARAPLNTWRAQVNALSVATHRWTGNHAGIIEVSLPDLRKMVNNAHPILEDLRTDGVDLAGTALRSLLREARQ